MGGGRLWIDLVLQKNFEHKFVITDVGAGSGKLYGSGLKFIDDMITDRGLYVEKGISRSYLLIGRPGTGKTSIVSHLVEKIGGSCVFTRLGIDPGEIVDKLCIMKPAVIVFDDCDRGIVGSALHLIEEIKAKIPGVTIFLIANRFAGVLEDEAFVRNGRLDRVYEVDLPNEKDIREILSKYVSEYELKLGAEDFEYCVKRLITGKKTGADIWALCQGLMKESVC
jgi:SpoVK/Ycf46/Vps4 family AAA+-type ATPase